MFCIVKGDKIMKTFKRNIIPFVVITSCLFAGCTTEKESSDAPVELTTEKAMEYGRLFSHDMNGIIAIDSDGSVLLNKREGFSNFEDALEWDGLVQVSMGYNNVYGLFEDGAVAGGLTDVSKETNNLSEFTDITSIAATDSGVYGLKSDGTVIGTGGGAMDVSDWSDVI